MSTTNVINKRPSCWVIVPAAGIGLRMRADRPKQYLPLFGSTVLEYTLTQLLNHAQVQGVVVSIAEQDHYWAALPIANHPRIIAVAGGEERCHSVLNGLQALRSKVNSTDWVMVHDIARPCLTQAELNNLFDASLNAVSDGFVLGMPVRDAMKQTTGKGVIEVSPDRSRLWHAFTPQMFRFGELVAAIKKCIEMSYLVTDEASAMEQCGYRVQMISGSANNIKITRSEDLQLAEFILSTKAE